jgi:C-terminal processing protease CtpA/Prc
LSPHKSAPWVEHQQAYWATTDAYLSAPPEHINTAGIRHGWLDTSIAFISIHHMNTDPAFGKHMTDEALRVVTELTQTYQDAAGIVLDLRFATGGSDKVALSYASAFSDSLFVAGYKATQMTHEQFTQNTPLWVSSTQTPLRQPVIALTSTETMGASEVLVAALKSLPNVTVMGMPTAGAPSDILGRTLPNGWKFTLPHQRVFMANGDLVGTSGIAPDILLPFDAEDFSQGKDTALEAAIAQLLTQ